MSHGYQTVMVGDCPVCGRRDVGLREYRRADGDLALSCTDQFSCLDAWAAQTHESPAASRS